MDIHRPRMLDLDSKQAVGTRHSHQKGHVESTHPDLFGVLDLTEAIDVVPPCDRFGEDQLGWTLPPPREVRVRGAHLSGQPIILWLSIDSDSPIAGDSACDCERLCSDERTPWKGWSSSDDTRRRCCGRQQPWDIESPLPVSYSVEAVGERRVRLDYSMKVSVLRGPKDLAVEDRERPQPGPNEVLVRVSSVGVCGSDTHYYDHGRIGRFVVQQPLILGHEASGVIEDVGQDVHDRLVGQRVSIEPGVPDLYCPQCLAGRYNLCPNMRFFATPPIDGAFAEYVVVHSAFAHPIPDTITDNAAALLEPLSVGVWACRKGHVTAGSRVLVTGAGPIGLVSVQTALAFGATEVVVSDVNPARLDLARELGATETVDVRTASLTDLPRPPEVLLECSGHPAATGDAIRALGPAGRAVLVGMGGEELPLPL